MYKCTPKHSHMHRYVHTHTGAIAVTSGIFSDPSQSPTVSEVQCTGAETDLLSCTRSNAIDRSSCGNHDDAGVVCQGSNITIHVANSNSHNTVVRVRK